MSSGIISDPKGAMRNQSGASNKQIETWRYLRWKGRTDLFFLCQNILGDSYSKVNKEFHQPLISMLQQFPMSYADSIKMDILNPAEPSSSCFFRSSDERKSLPGARRRLILDFRSAGKTTLNAKAHTIQWILNFPDIAIAIDQAKMTKAQDILKGIKGVFLYTPQFRDIYPEFCPRSKTQMREFGNQELFTIPNRKRRDRSEATCMAISIDSATAGYHWEVMKHSDIVDPSNVKTQEQIQKTNEMFEMYKKLLVDPDDWIDVEGTRYDYSDLYGKIIEEERRRPVEERKWLFFVRGVYKKDTGIDPATNQPYPQVFIPEELELPTLMKEGKPVGWYPERFNVLDLEAERRMSPEADANFATQMLNNPLEMAIGERDFDLKYFREIPRRDYANVPISYHEICVDTAETTGARSDYSVLSVGAWSGSGKLYIPEIRHGKMQNDQLVSAIFDLQLKYRPRAFKIEETAFVRGFKPTIMRECARRNIWPNFEWIKRDNQTSKVERIKGLQPWYKGGDLIFLDDLACRESLRNELNSFPKYKHDDILDTLADLFQGKEWFGRNTIRKTEREIIQAVTEAHFCGSPWEEEDNGGYFNRTGGL